MLIEALLFLLIPFQRFFRGRNYAFKKISQTHFIFDKNYDPVIRDYYEYVESLIEKNLQLTDAPTVILLDCKGFDWLKIFWPIKKITFQIEHTLVKPGARDSDGAQPSPVFIPGSSNRYLLRLGNAAKLDEADVVIEYSQINQFHIRQIDNLAIYAAKSFCISPALYPLIENLIAPNERQLDTVTLFGNPNEPRRKKFLENLFALNVKHKNINNVFDGLEDLYQNIKILINIRQTDHHDTLEELRILPALRCGVIVVSERAPLVEKTRYSKYIIWSELDEIPAVVADIQNNYAFWHKKIFEDSGFVGRMERISRCNELVSLKVVKHLNAI